MTRYFDASALVKRYVWEAGSARCAACSPPRSLPRARLSEVEVSSGIIRRAHEGALTIRARDRMLAALQRDLPALVLVEMIPEITADERAAPATSPAGERRHPAGQRPLPAAAAG